jgi:hypothetical protein
MMKRLFVNTTESGAALSAVMGFWIATCRISSPEVRICSIRSSTARVAASS